MQNLQLLYYIYHDAELEDAVLEEKKHIIHVLKAIINERDRTDPIYRKLQDMINQYEIEFPNTISDSDLAIFTKVVDEFEALFKKVSPRVASTPDVDGVFNAVVDVKNKIQNRLLADKDKSPSPLSPLMTTSAGKEMWQDFENAYDHLTETLDQYYSAKSQSYLEAEIITLKIRDVIAGIKRTCQSFYTKPTGFVFGKELDSLVNEIIAYGDLEQEQEAKPETEQEQEQYLLDRWKYSTKMKPLHDALVDLYQSSDDDKDLAELRSAVTKAVWTVYDSDSDLDDKFFALDDLNELTPKSLGQKLRDALTVIATTLAAAALALFFIASIPMTFATGNIILGSSVAVGMVTGGLLVYFGLFANNAESTRRTAVSLAAMGKASLPDRPKPAEIASVPVQG